MSWASKLSKLIKSEPHSPDKTSQAGSQAVAETSEAGGKAPALRTPSPPRISQTGLEVGETFTGNKVAETTMNQKWYMIRLRGKLHGIIVDVVLNLLFFDWQNWPGASAQIQTWILSRSAKSGFKLEGALPNRSKWEKTLDFAWNANDRSYYQCVTYALVKNRLSGNQPSISATVPWRNDAEGPFAQLSISLSVRMDNGTISNQEWHVPVRLSQQNFDAIADFTQKHANKQVSAVQSSIVLASAGNGLYLTFGPLDSQPYWDAGVGAQVVDRTTLVMRDLKWDFAIHSYRDSASSRFKLNTTTFVFK